MLKRFVRILICILLFLLSSASAGREELLSSGGQPVPDDAHTKDDTAHIRIVGDVMVHEHQLQAALQEDGSYDFSDSFARIAWSLRSADYTIANLETIIIPDQPYTGYPQFNTPPSLLDALKDCGIDFLTLANNHMLDSGFDGLVSTVDQVEAAGFRFAGARRTPEEAEVPAVVTVNGIRIGFLCYTQTANGNEKKNWRAREYGLALMSEVDPEADVQKLRDAGAEFIICLPHWGTEYYQTPDEPVRKKAERLVSAGVDLIVGSHPHVVQPFEMVTVETREGERTVPVLWSLGNFISNMYRQYTYSGVIFDFTIRRNEDGSCIAGDFGVVPLYVWNREDRIRLVCSGAASAVRPRDMTDEEYEDMKTTYEEITEIIGDEAAVLQR